MIRVVVLIVFFSFLLGISSTLYSAEDKIEDEMNEVQLGLGQKKKISVVGSGFFAADDTVIKILSEKSSSVTILALQIGRTQLLYWKDGLLDAVEIAVLPPQTLGFRMDSPRFKLGKPYFIYDFSNTSNYSNDYFFLNPQYTHNMGMQWSSGKASFTGNTVFTHSGLHDGKVTSVRSTYINDKVRFTFGNSSFSMNRFQSVVLSGVSFLGTNFYFKDFYHPFDDDYKATFEIFGGVDQPPDLSKIKDEGRVAGFNYFVQGPRADVRYPNLINVGFVTFQPTDRKDYNFAGSLEGNYLYEDFFSLGAGGYVSKGGFAAQVLPFFQNEKGYTSAKYYFVKKGLMDFSGTRTTSDRHHYEFSTQQELKDQISFLSASLLHDINLDVAAFGSTDNLTFSLGYQRRPAFKNSYGLRQSVSKRTADGTLLANYTTLFFNQPIGMNSYLMNNVTYNREDLKGSLNRVDWTSDLRIETGGRYLDIGANAWYSRGSNNSDGARLNASTDFYFRRMSLRFNLTYTKQGFRGNNHQLSFSPSLDFQVTSLHRLALSASNSYSYTGVSRFIGSLRISYRQYFGPGIESDSLIKGLFTGSKNQKVEGMVFIDNNYNGRFDEGDVPLTGVNVRIDGKNREVTDAHGRFIFSRVSVGDHDVTVSSDALKLLSGVPDQSLTITGDNAENLFFPFILPRATLRVQLIMDVNDNGISDEGDYSISLPKLNLKDSSGSIRTFHNVRDGAIFEGVEKGEASLWLDSADIPDDIEPVSDIQKRIEISDYQEYVVNFLFKPIRSLRGKVSIEGDIKVKLQPLIVMLGEHESNVDSEGYYWIKDLIPGQFKLIIKNLPPKMCISDKTNLDIKVPEKSFIEQMDIRITDKCNGNGATE
ncbi:MAG: hypothetical protein ABIE74_06475 [Pseudomonadota bacterium]